MRICKLFLLGVTTEVTLANQDETWSKEDFQKNLADKVDKMPDNIEKIEHEQHPEEKRIELLKREYLGPSLLMYLVRVSSGTGLDGTDLDGTDLDGTGLFATGCFRTQIRTNSMESSISGGSFRYNGR